MPQYAIASKFNIDRYIDERSDLEHNWSVAGDPLGIHARYGTFENYVTADFQDNRGGNHVFPKEWYDGFILPEYRVNPAIISPAVAPRLAPSRIAPNKSMKSPFSSGLRPTLTKPITVPSRLRPPGAKSGVGGFNDWLNDAVNWVQDTSSAAGENIGEISQALLEAGYTIEQISMVLDGVANSPITTEQQLAAYQAQLAAIRAQEQSSSQSLIFFLLIGGAIYFATQEGK